MSDNQSELKKSFLKGIFWTSIEKFGNVGLQFIVGIILARLILPSEFGLLGMIAIFIAISQSIIDSGFREALVRDKNSTEETYSSVFIFNIFISVIIYLTLFISAPFIAEFYKEPQIVLIIRVVSLSFVIGSFSIIQQTLFQKELKFKQISINVISTTSISGVVATILAYHGYGIWALVIMKLLSSTLSTTLFWLTSSWRFKPVFNKNEIKRLFPFSSKLLFSSILENIYINTSSALIGRYFLPKDVGFYDQGKKLQTLPIGTLTSVIASVLYPSFSKIESDSELKIKLQKVIKLSIFIIFPISVLLILVSKSIILLLLTKKWENSIVYLQILALGGMLYPLHVFNLQIYKIKGCSDIFLKLEIIKKIVGFTLMFLSIPYGVIFLVIFESSMNFLLYPLNAYYNGKIIGYKITEQIKDVFPIFLVAFLPGLLLYLVNIDIKSNFLEILVLSLVYGASYLLLSYIFLKDTINDMLNILKGLKKI
ncbi:lipopolysaccharide biosynthesis protein [bacterium]|nr:lipopolysaccharide biosynthesis protein [bacterium]